MALTHVQQNWLSAFKLSQGFDSRTHILEWRDNPSGVALVCSEPAWTDCLAAQLGALHWEAQMLLLPDVALGGRTSGWASCSAVALRAEARQSAELLTQLWMGSRVEILEKAGLDFYRVRSFHGPHAYIGYLHREHWVLANPCWASPYTGLAQKMVLADFVFATADKYEASERVFDVSAGCTVGVSAESEGWAQIATPDMRLGWVRAEALMAMPILQKFNADAFAAQALRYMGVPYLWGGTTPHGLDCSGLVQLCAALHGLHVPRDAGQQALIGTAVDLLGVDASRSLQKGDLLFFGQTAERITHVAIYLGEGRYVHASGRVRINSLVPTALDFAPERRVTLQTARRLW